MEYWDFHAINFWILRFVIIILQYSRKSKTKENDFPVLGGGFGGDKKTGARYEQCEDDHHSGPMDDLRGGLSFQGWMDVSRPGFCRVALAAKLIIHCSQSYFSAGFLSAVLVFDPLNPIRDPQYLLCGLCISRMEYRGYIYKKWFLNPSFRICHCLVHTIRSCQFCKKTSTSQLLDKMYHTHLNYVRICARS